MLARIPCWKPPCDEILDLSHSSSWAIPFHSHIMSSMLTYHEMRLVKATIPKLREQGEKITTLMYGGMLRDHPELNNMFNTVNQVRLSSARNVKEEETTFEKERKKQEEKN